MNAKSKAQIASELKAAFAAGALVSFEPPGANGKVIITERRQVEQSMSLWTAMPPAVREESIEHVRRNVARGYKRFDRLTQKQADDLAMDCILLLAHDLVFADGEKMLRETVMPDMSGFES